MTYTLIIIFVTVSVKDNTNSTSYTASITSSVVPYVRLIKLVSSKCCHAGFDSSGAEGYEYQT